MTAPALNLNSIAAPGAGAAGLNTAGPQGAGAAAGFEALIAALFPAGPASSAAEAAGPARPKGDGSEPATAEQGLAPDAAMMLAAATTIQTAQDPATPVTAKAPGEAASPAQDQAHAAFTPPSRGEPIQQQAAKGATMGEAIDDDPALADASGVTPDAHADKPAPPAFGRDKPRAVPAQPALDNANPKADLAAKAAPAVPVDTPDQVPIPTPPRAEAAPVAASEAVQAPAFATQAARTEPAPAPAAAKSSRAERRSAANATDSAIATGPTEAADKPVQAKSVHAAAKPASDTVEAVETQSGEARAEADHPDTAPQGETRAATNSTAAAAHEAHPVRGAPETVANLAAQIIKKLEAKTTRFDLELDPHGLGRVDVRVEIGAHGKMTAAMVFENPQAAQELKARSAELQRVLEQAGFDLSGGLSFDVADQGRHQGQAWQDQAEGGASFRGHAFRSALETAGEAVDAATTGALRLRRGVNAGVDVRI